MVRFAEVVPAAGDGPGPAERGMLRWLVRAVAMLRVAQLTPWLPVAVTSDWGTYRHPGWVAGLYAGVVFWALALFGVGLTRGRVTLPWAVGDVLAMAACLIVVGQMGRGAATTGWQNWTLGPAMGAALVAVIFIGARAGVLAAGSLTVCYVIGASGDLSRTATREALIGNAVSLIAFSVAGGLAARELTRAARRADQAAQAAAVAHAAQAETEVRFDERTRQYRLLHDNVLSTLAAIARGGLDYRTDAVRQRCAADAEFLRGLITAVDDDASIAALPIELAKVGRAQAALGLRVHHSSDGLPHDLPHRVVVMTALAVTEALNNVVKHADVGEAWVTALGSHGGVTVTVADRGRGFDPATTPPGLGTSGSLRQRMAEVGGEALVHSAPGEGTVVELRWPK